MLRAACFIIHAKRDNGRGASIKEDGRLHACERWKDDFWSCGFKNGLGTRLPNIKRDGTTERKWRLYCEREWSMPQVTGLGRSSLHAGFNRAVIVPAADLQSSIAAVSQTSDGTSTRCQVVLPPANLRSLSFPRSVHATSRSNSKNRNRLICCLVCDWIVRVCTNGRRLPRGSRLADFRRVQSDVVRAFD